jgi:osmotically-inducible protein OsmY
MIKQLCNVVITEETEAQFAIRIQEAMLAQEVKHHLLYEKELPIHFLEVTVSGDKITLYGVANSHALVDATVTAAIELALKCGALAVRSEIQIVQEYSVVP